MSLNILKKVQITFRVQTGFQFKFAFDFKVDTRTHKMSVRFYDWPGVTNLNTPCRRLRLTRVTWPHRPDNQAPIPHLSASLRASQSETHHGLLMIFCCFLFVVSFRSFGQDTAPPGQRHSPGGLPAGLDGCLARPGNLLEFAKRIKYANKRFARRRTRFPPPPESEWVCLSPPLVCFRFRPGPTSG